MQFFALSSKILPIFCVSSSNVSLTFTEIRHKQLHLNQLISYFPSKIATDFAEKRAGYAGNPRKSLDVAQISRFQEILRLCENWMETKSLLSLLILSSKFALNV